MPGPFRARGDKELFPALMGETDQKQEGRQIRTIECDIREGEISVSGAGQASLSWGTLQLRPEGEGVKQEQTASGGGCQVEGMASAKAQRRKGQADDRNSDEARVLGTERARGGRWRKVMRAKSQGDTGSGILSQAWWLPLEGFSAEKLICLRLEKTTLEALPSSLPGSCP